VARRLPNPLPALPRFAVAWFPSFDGIERIEAYRARFDPLAHEVAVHLTLVFPFPTPLTRLQVESHVKRVAAGWPPVSVTFRHVRAKDNEFVFLMAARGAASIVALHDRLYTRSLAPHLRRDLPYEPHMTVARCPDPERLDEALARAAETMGGDYAGVMRELTLIAMPPGGKIERVSTFPLLAG
jgi:2'-5' RNA ligase